MNLDQLEMIKDQGSSAEEEDEPEVMEAEDDGKNLIEAQDEDMEGTGAEDLRETDGDEGLEGGAREEEREEAEEQEGEQREGVTETTPEKSIVQDALSSPTSSSGAGLSAEAGKRLPCEFCGRCFSNSSEWERHVLRHGMVINNSPNDTSSTSAIEASSSMCSSVLLEPGLDLSNISKEEDDLINAPQTSSSLYMEDKEMLDTKNDHMMT